MKLLQLELRAFGPFTGHCLDFAEERPVLNLVYGSNEAGKSTALRAIGALFYGVEERTQDNHLHRNPDLRIAGKVSWGEGEALSFMRRKGRKGTLLDEDGKVLDETQLQRALGGVSKQLFSTMFGLDHRTLREGAHALLQGGGEVGESLFDAGGGRGVHRVLEQLRSEARELYKPGGSKPLLSRALSSLKEAKQSITQQEMLPESYLAQQEELTRQRDERQQLIARRQQYEAERQRLGRLRAVLPQLAQLRQLREQLTSLGEVPAWLSDNGPRREQTQLQQQNAKRDVERHLGEVSALRKQQDNLKLNAPLAGIAKERVAEVRDALGNHRKSAQDLPKREAELAALQQDMQLILKQLGSQRSLAEVEQLRVDTATEVRLNELVLEHPRRVAEQSGAQRALQAWERRTSELAEQLAQLPDKQLSAPLRLALRRASRGADAEQRIGVLTREVEKINSAIQQQYATFKQLPETFSVDSVMALTPPSKEQVQRFDQQRQQLASDTLRLIGDEERLAAEREQTQQALEVLELSGDVPTVEILTQLRGDRDTLLERLIDELRQGEDAALVPFTQASEAADSHADRMWQQADRVAQAAQLRTKQASHQRKDKTLAEGRRAQSLADAAWEERWRACWQGLLLPEAPIAMLSWLERFAQLRAQLERVAELSAKRQGAEDELAEHRAELLAVWSAPAADLPFSRLLDAAGAALEQLQEIERKHDALAGVRQQHLAQRSELSAAAEASQAAFATWQSRWTKEVTALGLPAEASVAEAVAVRDRLRELFSKVKDSHDKEQRIRGMQRDAEHFAELLRGLLQQAMPAMLERPSGEAADELLAAYQQACAADTEQQRIERELATRLQQQEQARGQLEAAEQQLQAMVERAAVANLEALEELEQRAHERQQLSVKRQEVSDILLKLGDGRTVAELEQLSAESDADQVAARLEELNGELSEVGAGIDRATAGMAKVEAELGQHLHAKDGAFVAALNKQTCVAEVRRHAERYAKVKLATLVLEREIERYRQENQGPVVAHASRLFQTLTLQRYSSLRVDYAGGDEPELRCVRADDTRVSIDGLSDGTRDQLYLALRLASLRRYAQRAEMMPFVLDDILVHFDDDRASAALQVLAELSEVTQVLFFTHHQRLVELAKAVVPAERLREHRLPSRAVALPES